MASKKTTEYIEGKEAFENFDRALSAVIKVPHSEIKAQMDAEKKEKKRKPKTSASGHASGGKD